MTQAERAARRSRTARAARASSHRAPILF
ncbi:hypothetical protein M218_26300 [Burkholderia pseudomallei MSHR338]|nr:hypothetical protein M218_26300 [Burkholderia pseudomallei MSHR338]